MPRKCRLEVIGLGQFLNKTLGGFAEPPPEHWDATIARMYPAGEKVDVIMLIAGVSRPTVYASLERQSIRKRKAA